MTRSQPAVALCVARSGEGVEIGRARMVRAVEAASADGASLVVLGEALPTGLVNSDDPDEDLLLGESIPGATTRCSQMSPSVGVCGLRSGSLSATAASYTTRL